ncbi:MAG: zinc-dependent peptidase [Phycisphaerales bacterium]|nr:zinc-dependent peptidase [Phycisphaerales bacterium]
MNWIRATLGGAPRQPDSTSIDPAAAKAIAANLPVFSRLDADRQTRLLSSAGRFMRTKEFVGRDGMQVTDEMRAVVSAAACMLLLGMPDDSGYRRVSTVAIHRGSFSEAVETYGPEGERYVVHNWAAGKAWSLGFVELAWDSVLYSINPRQRGFNVIYHEFAHALDAADGDMGGMPPLPSWSRERAWRETMQRSFDRLANETSIGRRTPLSAYGATSLVEFFPVATEAFFERPTPLAGWDAGLFEILREYYGQDPREYE